jgi:hypothetical protein
MRCLVPSLILLVLGVVTSLTWSLHGMNWSDGPYAYAYGNLLLQDEVFYRDYVYSLGFIPLLIDGLAQKIFGPYYWITVAIGIVLRCLKLLVDYQLFRCVSGPKFALLIAAGLACTNIRAINHGYAWTYLLVHFAGLCLLRGSRSESARPAIWYGIAGTALALIIGVRQSNGVVGSAAVFLVFSILAVQNGREFLRRCFLPFGLGWAAAIIVQAGILVALGALQPCIQQLFLDAADKKDLGGPLSYLNQLVLGGAFTADYALLFNVLPLTLVLMIVLCHRRPEKDTSIRSPWIESFRRQAILFIPFAVLLGQVAGFLQWEWNLVLFRDLYWFGTLDVPRFFLGLLLVGTLILPSAIQEKLNLDYRSVALLLAAALGVGLAFLLSFPGRTYADRIDLDFWSMLLILAMIPGSQILKQCLIGATVAVMAIHSACGAAFGNPSHDPFLGGSIAVNQQEIAVPALYGIKVHKLKADLIRELRSRIQPGDSCFIAGAAPGLYPLLECRNPTRLYLLYPDFYVYRDAEEAVEALKNDPPQWIIATQVGLGMAPPGANILEMDDSGSPHFYGPFKQDAARLLHRSLREMLKDYDLVFQPRDLYSKEELAELAAIPDVDRPAELRLYRRKSNPAENKP